MNVSFHFTWVNNPEAVLLGCLVSLYLTILHKKLASYFPKWAVIIFAFLPAMDESSGCS